MFANYDRFPRSRPREEQKYLILTNAGDEYLTKIEVTGLEGSKLHFYWTKDRSKGKEFTGAEISKSFYHVIQAFSGPILERIF